MAPPSRRSCVLFVIGTRPEAIKLAPVIRALRGCDWADVRVLTTAQHRELADAILAFFEIPVDVDLDLMRPDQALPDLTARMIIALDAALAREQPDLIVAQGDTTTVMVAALCGYYRRIPVAHVEAGLRTGNRFAPFPEEANRILAAHLADLHFAPTPAARDNLLKEGIDADRITVTGNTVIDALLWAAARDLPPPFVPTPGRRVLLVTAHRREHFGRPLEEICDALADLARRPDVEIVYPVHPNPNVRGVVEGRLDGRPNIHLLPALDYPQFVAAMKTAFLIMTDSGGVQEEAPSLGKPVIVLRDRTERPEGVAAGTACVVGPHRERIIEKTVELLDSPAAYARMAQARNPYGDGRASGRIVTRLQQFLADRRGA